MSGDVAHPEQGQVGGDTRRGLARRPGDEVLLGIRFRQRPAQRHYAGSRIDRHNLVEFAVWLLRVGVEHFTSADENVIIRREVRCLTGRRQRD